MSTLLKEIFLVQYLLGPLLVRTPRLRGNRLRSPVDKSRAGNKGRTIARLDAARLAFDWEVGEMV